MITSPISFDRFAPRAVKAFACIAFALSANCHECHADKTYRVPGSTCETCHVDAEDFFAGRTFTSLAPPLPDPMHGLVQCIDCHHLDDPEADADLVRGRCASCHTKEYGLYLSQGQGLIEAWIQNVTGRKLGQGSEKTRPIIEAVRKFAPHNFMYSRRLFDSLEPAE